MHFLNRLPLNIVMEMFSTAEPISAERALQIGIVNELLPAERLEEHTYKIDGIIAQRSAEAIGSFKAMARALAEAAPLSPAAFEQLHGLRRRVYLGPDYCRDSRIYRKALATFQEAVAADT